MNGSMLLRLALRSYPSEARTATDQEITATALEICDGSPLALTVQAASLLYGGLKARTRLGAQQPLRRLLIEGLGTGAMLLLAFTLASLLNRWPPHWGVWPADLVLAPVLWALGFRRVAGLIALISLATHDLTIGWSLGDGGSVSWVDPYGIAAIIAGALLLLAVPSPPRPSISARLRGLTGLVLSCVVYVWVADSSPMLFPWLLCGTLALVALPFAPALSLGLGVYGFAHALQHSLPIAGPAFPLQLWTAGVLLQWCALPAAVLLIAGTRRRVRALT